MRALIAMWAGVKKLFGFLDRHDGSITALATLAIVGLTFVYVKYSKKQWEAMGESNQTSRNALMLAQRAYLSVGTAEVITPGIRIPIANIGHVPAKIINGSFTYLRGFYPSMSLADERSKELETDKLVITPGETSAFGVFIAIPELTVIDRTAVEAGTQFLAINGALTFDTGFNSTDTVLVNFAYNQSSKRWERTSEGRSINFRQIQPKK